MYLKLPISLLLLTATFLSAQTGTRWITTHDGNSSGNCKLEISKVTVLAHSFYLDVEEEAEIVTEGIVSRGDPNTLEITGEFTLSPGTAIRSMLLWDGSKILKAKLRDRRSADSLYEQIVDRDKPKPVVRDPALIEKIGDNKYRFKIYPVAINKSRKLRILYSIPMQAFGNLPAFEIKTAFTNGPASYPNNVPVEIKNPDNLTNTYILNYGSIKKALQFNVSYLIPSDNIIYKPYIWSPAQAVSFYLIPDSSSYNRAFKTVVESGSASGHYMAVFPTIPDSVRVKLIDLEPIKSKLAEKYNLEAQIKTSSASFIHDIPLKANPECIGVYLKSTSSWDNVIYWNVYDKNGTLVYQHSNVFFPDSNEQKNKFLPLFWGAKYSLDEGNGSLGAIYGFIDSKMSLLAVEADSLPKIESTQWEASGVPHLLSSEIIIAESQMPTAPFNRGIFEIQDPIVAISDLFADATSTSRLQLLSNGLVIVDLGDKKCKYADVSLYTLNGQVVYTLKLSNLQNGVLQFKLPYEFRGKYILRVKTASQNLVWNLMLP